MSKVSNLFDSKSDLEFPNNLDNIKNDFDFVISLKKL
jgi:hypothetical protein